MKCMRCTGAICVHPELVARRNRPAAHLKSAGAADGDCSAGLARAGDLAGAALKRLGAGAAATAVYANSKSWAVVIPIEAWSGGIASPYIQDREQREPMGLIPRRLLSLRAEAEVAGICRVAAGRETAHVDSSHRGRWGLHRAAVRSSIPPPGL